MPRDLGDVLHLFAPELAGTEPNAASAPRPLIGVPLARPDRTVLALLRNLAVETARQGVGVSLCLPAALADDLHGDPTRPGVSEQRVADDPAALVRGAEQALRAAPRFEPSVAFAAFPAAWLAKASEIEALLRWTLVFVRPDEAALADATAALESIASQAPRARLGVTVYGVRTLTEARDCFEHLALAIERRFGPMLTSYGVLVDDVRLSRSIVTGRPIALASPHSASARALADVASLLLGDSALDRDA